MSSSGGEPAPHGIRLFLVTAPEAEARALARALVEERLVACGNVLPGVSSIYRWQGRVEEAEEALLVLKAAASRREALLRRIPELHSYEVPEVLEVEIPAGHPPYVAWVIQESTPDPASEGG